MGFGFRVGVPGTSVRVSTRGVRASVGPRLARVHVGGGRTALSSGLGPFSASTALGGARRRTVARRAPRATGPSAAQLERAQRAAEREQREAERAVRIAELRELRRRSTSVHLQDFAPAHPPVVPPPDLGERWARAEAEAFHPAWCRALRAHGALRGPRQGPLVSAELLDRARALL